MSQIDAKEDKIRELEGTIDLKNRQLFRKSEREEKGKEEKGEKGETVFLEFDEGKTGEDEVELREEEEATHESPSPSHLHEENGASDNLLRSLMSKEQENAILAEQLDTLSSAFKDLCREVRRKGEETAKLEYQLKLHNLTPNRYFPFSPLPVILFTIRKKRSPPSHERKEELRSSSAEEIHHPRNPRNFKREAELEAQRKIISKLSEEVIGLRKDKFSLMRKNTCSSDDPLLNELEELRKTHFFTLAVGLKTSYLLNGQFINVDLSQLFEEARYLHHSSWHDLVSEEFSKEIKHNLHFEK